MLSQLERYELKEVAVLDNGSDFRPMARLLKDIARTRIKVVQLRGNFGPRFLLSHAEILAAIPRVFLYSDPDIKFNKSLPAKFWETLEDVSIQNRVGKVGFALDISNPSDLRPDLFKIGDRSCTIWEWEEQYWQKPIPENEPLITYEAPIDTTFLLCNQDYYSPDNFYSATRIAGDFTADHIPWYRATSVPRDEVEFYKARQTASFYSLGPDE